LKDQPLWQQRKIGVEETSHLWRDLQELPPLRATQARLGFAPTPVRGGAIASAALLLRAPLSTTS
jgi:hypothetical protein